MGDKWARSVNSCGPRNPEWETRGRQVGETHAAQGTQSERQVWPKEQVGDKCGRQVWETSVGDKCKLMRPRHPEWETSVGDKWKTSVNSCGPRHPECETSGRQV